MLPNIIFYPRAPRRFPRNSSIIFFKCKGNFDLPVRNELDVSHQEINSEARRDGWDEGSGIEMQISGQIQEHFPMKN